MAGVDVEADMSGLFVGEEQASLFPDEDQTQGDGGTQMNATANMDGADGGEKKKRVIKNPQPKLNADRLMGPRGVHTIEELFKDWKPSGHGKEFEDLDVIMHKLNHWAHRLYPKLPFDDTLDIIANRLGNKKVVTTHVKKIRMGMLVNPVREEEVVDDRVEAAVEREVERYDGGEGEPEIDPFQQLTSRTAAPLSHSSPGPRSSRLTEEQLERMKRNKELAARKKKEREDARRKEEEEDELMRDLEEENRPDQDQDVLRRLHIDEEIDLDNDKETPRSSTGPSASTEPVTTRAEVDICPEVVHEASRSAAAAVEWSETSEVYCGPVYEEKGEKEKEKDKNVLTMDEMMDEME
ncbi:TIMELESS-interacting protein [Eurytemora carolleeae]|uniref:TIMELESS-interacting protein n=1 Tax=Eurytemora carolleeae TaxID=1294199 RepID=UPI000C7783DC|nr:TIMELESS-interacting protein [Eurytemora carolleeae]|eukprot:XP_023327913.1 TIMELESS-interacting protein-like [Eurytemora affinis]